jgi:hypothetical protein
LFSFDIVHPPLELNFKCPPNIFYDIEIRALWWPRKSGNVVYKGVGKLVPVEGNMNS